ncbi:MAG: sulfatase [Planctomycetota bacterium]
MAPTKAQRALAALIPFAAGAAFLGASLVPWMHLVGPGYLARFAGFAAGLAVVAALVGAVLRRALRREGALPAMLGAALVFVPTWFWNRVGEIDVILLHVDTLRADHCSVYGYERRTTPHLERFAAEHAVLFRTFIAQSAGTDKSTPAILASIYPSMFYDPGTDGSNFLVPDRFPLAGEYLRDAGYVSLGFSSNPVIGSRYNYPRGFTHFEELWHDEPRPAALVSHLRSRIEALDRHYFYFGLILDPHSPYAPAEGFNVYAEDPALTYEEIGQRVFAGDDLELYLRPSIDLYDGEILEVDAALGTLIEWLEESGRMDHTMLIVTSDHGEAFLEHGFIGHGGTLFEEVIHVPLLWSFPSPLRFPRLEPSVRDVAPVASQVDLLPTILGFLGQDIPRDTIQGDDLTPRLFGREPWPERAILSEELGDGVETRSLRSDRYKLVERRNEDGTWTRVVVDLVASPDERDLVAEGELVERLLADLHARLDAARGHYAPKEQAQALTADEAQELRDLGYF